jgi:hypothetical protein
MQIGLNGWHLMIAGGAWLVTGLLLAAGSE